ncbi:ATP-grasp fold amidoligase family protein [Vibrio breoganii]
MKKLKYFVRDLSLRLLGMRYYTIFRFILTHGYYPQLEAPRSWNEKIQNRKIYSDPKLYSKLVDKYYVREYVSRTVGHQYLIPLIARYEFLSPEDFNDLPQSFVIKTSNGGGGVNVKVVRNKGLLSYNESLSIFNENIKKNTGYSIGELFYDIEDASIVVEKLIENSNGTALLDYKFHIFKSRECVKILLQINKNYGKKDETKTIYSLDGIRSDIQFKGYRLGKEKIDLPDNLQEMVDLAIKLSGDFNYCRVDLYNVDNNIYFGEMTFCPASGWDRLNKKEHDFLLGSYWA